MFLHSQVCSFPFSLIAHPQFIYFLRKLTHKKVFADPVDMRFQFPVFQSIIINHIHIIRNGQFFIKIALDIDGHEVATPLSFDGQINIAAFLVVAFGAAAKYQYLFYLQIVFKRINQEVVAFSEMPSGFIIPFSAFDVRKYSFFWPGIGPSKVCLKHRTEGIMELLS